MNAVKHSGGCLGVPARRLAVALSAASLPAGQAGPRCAAGFPLQSLTRNALHVNHRVMSRLFFTFLGLILSVALFAQKKGKADDIFQKAIVDYEKENYWEAAQGFKTIVDHHPKFKYYDQCTYNLAQSLSEADSVDLAIEWYERIRGSKVKDDDPVGGRGIFEPLSNYKHYSTRNIGTIEYNRGNYTKALDYYQQCLNVYPYRNTSGTDLRIQENIVTVYIADCLEKLNRQDEALVLLLAQTLDSEGSSNYRALVARTLKLIDKSFSRDSVLVDLDSSLPSLTMASSKRELNWTFKAKTQVLEPYWWADSELTAEAFALAIKKSEFWTELSKPK
jgi:tetratricopeptide (TPR) repeat protein